MKPFKISILIIIIATAAICSSAFGLFRNKPADNKGFAVVELFTSEGCSSCPPADALIAKVQKESAGQPVYILAMHVDYWDRLGWKDAFSSADYTHRQQQYARWLRLSQLYTPQAIVNGTKEFVGSEEGTLRNTLKAYLQKPAKTEVSLADVKVHGNKAALQYHVIGTTSNTSLVLALVEKNATTKVLRGENGGRTLSHVQIVRKLENIALNDHTEGSAVIALPEGFTPERYELIAFAQNTANGEITGATRAEFSPTLSK